jgi:hypothetical protein
MPMDEHGQQLCILCGLPIRPIFASGRKWWRLVNAGSDEPAFTCSRSKNGARPEHKSFSYERKQEEEVA